MAFWNALAFALHVLLPTGLTVASDQVRVSSEAGNYSQLNPWLCELRIHQKLEEPSGFQSPTKGKIRQETVLYTVSSQYERCQIHISDLFKEFVSKEYVVVYIGLACIKDNLDITLVEDQDLSLEAIGYGQLWYCGVSLKNIGLLGLVMDLNVFTCIHCAFKETVDPGPPANENTTAILPGMSNLVALILTTAQEQPLPSGLLESNWDSMAEITLDGFQIDSRDLAIFQRHMPRLQSIELRNTNLPSLPEFPWDSTPLALPKNLSRTHLFNDIYGETYGIPVQNNLFRRTLLMEMCNLTHVTSGQFYGMLDMISLDGNRIEELPADVFANVRSVFHLKLSSNLLRGLPDAMLSHLTMLTQLDLSYNHIVSISEHTFTGLTSLEVFSMSNNHLKSIPANTFSNHPNIVSIDLSNNQIEHIDDEAFGGEFPYYLEKVNFENNRMISIPGWVFTIRRLSQVRMSGNLLSFDVLLRHVEAIEANVVVFYNSESASATSRPFKPRRAKLIDLSHNNFTSLDLNSTNLLLLAKLRIVMNFFAIDLSRNAIECGCDAYNLFKFLQEERKKPFLKHYSDARVDPYYFKAWKCSTPSIVNGSAIADLNPLSFRCEKDIKGCPALCRCFERIHDGSVIANCSGCGLSSIPKALPPRTDTLLLNNNLIESLDEIESCRSLRYLDLSDNLITSIRERAVTAMSNISKICLHNNLLNYFPQGFQRLKGPEVTLSGNNIICDCHSKWLVRWIFSYRTKIPDINNVVCSTGRPMSQVVYLAVEDLFVCELSKEAIQAIAISTGCILTLAIVLLVLAYKFRGEIKVFLFYHFKWHPFDRTDKTDVVDKLYDAFVSYSQVDTEWVMQTLQPGLENERTPYRLCIHERDFRPGGMISDNVLFSVKYSRRMVMVLTKSFLDSEWCKLEFKSAHQRVLKDQTNYLIVILFDGLNIDDLDEDMKLYLKTNTYIEHDSKWFWQRMLYAMPQKPLSVLRQEAFPDGGYGTLFPSPDSVAIMQHNILTSQPQIEEQMPMSNNHVHTAPIDTTKM